MKKVGSFASKSHMGRVRVTNEDQVYAGMNKHHNLLLAVADGMGGHARGDLASRLAMTSIVENFQKTLGLLTVKTATLWLRSQVIEANQVIYKEAQKSSALKEMGTTFVIALIVRKTLIVLNIGDSRVYALDENHTLQRLTQDQSYVEYLYRQGKITLEQVATHPQRHVLLNAMGLNPTISYDIQVYPYENQRLLVCSDGLYNLVKDEEIRVLLASDDSVSMKVDTLIQLANSRGGHDNIAVAIWEPAK
jgi:serine/threonine protein phosphatase PrpC